MNIDILLGRALNNNKNIKNDNLDRAIELTISNNSDDVADVTRTSIEMLKNNSDTLSNWLSVNGSSRKETEPGIYTETIVFSSDIRKPKDDDGPPNMDHIFMYACFISNTSSEEITRLNIDPYAAMYEQALSYNVHTSDFLFAMIGCIHAVQQKNYILFEVHREEEPGELVFMFFNKDNKYQFVNITLNFITILSDRDLLDALDADENDIEYTDADSDYLMFPPYKNLIS